MTARHKSVMGKLPLILFIVLSLVALPSIAGPDPESERPGSNIPLRTGLPLPRFASLAAGKVNLRRGPDKIYPVDWVFVRKAMPVEIVDEYELWRKIRDSEGSAGWVHKSMLSGQRTALVVGEIRTLHRQPDASAEAVAQVEPGVIGRILSCHAEWCRIEAGSSRGWIQRSEMWGAYEREEID